jgi:hypothetical protein
MLIDEIGHTCSEALEEFNILRSLKMIYLVILKTPTYLCGYVYICVLHDMCVK